VKLFGLELTRSTRSTPGGLSPIGAANKGAWWPWIHEPSSGAWQRNITWTTDTVLAHHAVYACITRIAQDIGKLRPQLMEQGDDGIWSVVTNTAHSPVIRKPNRFQNHIQFKEWWATSKLVHGNTYVLLERDNRGVVVAMYVLDPTRVQVLVAPDGAVFYNLYRDNLTGLQEEEFAVPASEIIHDRINCLYHPLVGTSPIFACGSAANMGLQIEQNSSGFFANGSNPSGILTSVTTITPAKSAELSDLWNARFGKDKSGGVAVLGDGMKFEAMRMTAVDSQVIQQLGWTAETVCSTFHVPPWKIGVGQMPAYTKTEFANQAYYSDCLQSPIEQWELCMDEALGFDTPTEGRYLGVELDLDGLLRMDAASQITTLKEAVGGSIFTVNEARKKVDQPPVSGGDSIWMQQQNYSLEALQKRDEKADPFATGTAAPPGNAPDSNTPATPKPNATTEPVDPGTTDVARAIDTLIADVATLMQQGALELTTGAPR
jgi:HK97 family phage portal protein